MKKFCMLLTLIMSISCVNAVYASSENRVTKTPVLKDDMALEDVYLKIEPKDEVETGSTIYIDFTNAEVFSQNVIDGKGTEKEAGYKLGGYQYKGWSGESFMSFMPNVSTNELPYKITRMSKTQIEVKLINVPAKYAGNSLYDLNGVNSEPVYVIPMVVKTDGIGQVSATIDANGTSITGGSSGSVASAVNASSFVSTTETTNATTTEVTTETTSSEVYDKTVSVQIGSESIVVDGKTYNEGTAPYIQKTTSSTMVPLRAVSVALGGDMTDVDSSSIIKWDAETKKVYISYGSTEVVFESGSNVMIVNGTEKAIANGAVAEITNDRMYVPFRALGEALGVTVEWDSETKTATYKG